MNEKFGRTKNLFRRTMGTGTLKQGFSLLTLPFELFSRKRNKGAREEQERLKQMPFDELMEHWGLDQDKLPRLKRVLLMEMIAYICLAALGLSNLAYKTFNPEYNSLATAIGFMIAVAGILNFLLRHRWKKILDEKRYMTFKEYLLGD